MRAKILPATLHAYENGEFSDLLCARFEVKPNCDTRVPEPARMGPAGDGTGGYCSQSSQAKRDKRTGQGSNWIVEISPNFIAGASQRLPAAVPLHRDRRQL